MIPKRPQSDFQTWYQAALLLQSTFEPKLKKQLDSKKLNEDDAKNHQEKMLERKLPCFFSAESTDQLLCAFKFLGTKVNL